MRAAGKIPKEKPTKPLATTNNSVFANGNSEGSAKIWRKNVRTDIPSPNRKSNFLLYTSDARPKRKDDRKIET
jgi:hypothetical protein